MTDSLNVQISRALGWTGVKSVFRDGVEEWWGIRPGSLYDERIADFEHSLDASASVLPEHMTFEIAATRNGELSLPYRATLLDWVTGAPRWQWKGEGATRASALARAVLAWAIPEVSEAMAKPAETKRRECPRCNSTNVAALPVTIGHDEARLTYDRLYHCKDCYHRFWVELPKKVRLIRAYYVG